MKEKQSKAQQSTAQQCTEEESMGRNLRIGEHCQEKMRVWTNEEVEIEVENGMMTDNNIPT